VDQAGLGLRAVGGQACPAARAVGRRPLFRTVGRLPGRGRSAPPGAASADRQIAPAADRAAPAGLPNAWALFRRPPRRGLSGRHVSSACGPGRRAFAAVYLGTGASQPTWSHAEPPPRDADAFTRDVGAGARVLAGRQGPRRAGDHPSMVAGRRSSTWAKSQDPARLYGWFTGELARVLTAGVVIMAARLLLGLGGASPGAARRPPRRPTAPAGRKGSRLAATIAVGRSPGRSGCGSFAAARSARRVLRRRHRDRRAGAARRALSAAPRTVAAAGGRDVAEANLPPLPEGRAVPDADIGS